LSGKNGPSDKKRRNRAPSGQPRMSDVAELAGVSSLTVSRVFHHPEKVRENTRRKVEEAARKLHYVPNLVAGSLASTNSKVIAALVPHISNNVFSDVVQGVSDVLRSQGYYLLLGSTGASPEEEERLVTTLLGQRPAGMILYGGNHTSRTRGLLKRADIPVVETGNLVKRRIDRVVGFSNFDAGKAMTRFLAERGYRRIGFVSAPRRTNDRVKHRWQGYLEVVRELGLVESPDLYEEVPPLQLEEGARALTRIIERKTQVDAVFFASDVLAVGALFECQRRGISVPKDLAIVGFDDQQIATQVVPRLTTVHVPRYQIGLKAAEMLLQALDNPKAKKRVIDVGFEIADRETA
jgi:LacI family transcriptional regulator, gluconate utilization system Gnt-I transcriptional repressor